MSIHVAYFDPTGGRLWGLLWPRLKERLPLRDIVWRSRAVPPRQVATLPVELLAHNDRRLLFPEHVADRYRAPFLSIFLADADDNDEYKSKVRPAVRDWVGVRHSSQWLVIAVSTKPPPNKLFYVPMVEKLRSDLPRKEKVCALRLDDAAAQEQWHDLLARIKDALVASFDAHTTEVLEEVQRLQSVRHRPGWNFGHFFLVKECLALIFERSQLPESALVQYAEIEATFLDHLGLERNLGVPDSSWAPAGARSSTATLLTSDDKDYRQLIIDRALSRFDFLQYLFARQAKLSFLIKTPEAVLTKGIKFIPSARKELSQQELPPLFVEAWAFSAALSVANACLENIPALASSQPQQQQPKTAQSALLEVTSAGRTRGHVRSLSTSADPSPQPSPSPNPVLGFISSLAASSTPTVSQSLAAVVASGLSQSSSVLPAVNDKLERIALQMHFSIANLVFNARTELERMGSACGLWDPKGLHHVMLVETHALLHPGERLQEEPLQAPIRHIDDWNRAASASPRLLSDSPGAAFSSSPGAFPVASHSPPVISIELASPPEGGSGAVAANSQAPVMLNVPLDSSTDGSSPTVGQPQQQQQQQHSASADSVRTPGLVRSSSHSRIVSMSASSRYKHRGSGGSASGSSGSSGGVFGSSGSSPSPSSSPPVATRKSAMGSGSLAQAKPKDAATQQHQDMASTLPQLFWRQAVTDLPGNLTQEDIRKAIDNPLLLKALGSVDAFDELYIGLTIQAQDEFRLARRPQNASRLGLELAILHFQRKRWIQAEPLLERALGSFHDHAWTELEYYFLIMLSHCQITLEHYAEFAGSCLQLLSPRFELPLEQRSKISEHLFRVAAPKVAATTIKALLPELVRLELSRPAESLVHVNDKVSLQCTVTSSLPSPIAVDRVAVRLVSEGALLELQTKGELLIEPGISVLELKGMASLGGAFRCESVCLEVGNLRLSQAADANITFAVQYLPSTFDFDLRFPSWVPKTSERFLLPIVLRANRDDISSLKLAFSSPTTGFAPSPGTRLGCAIYSTPACDSQSQADVLVDDTTAGCEIVGLSAGKTAVVTFPADLQHASGSNAFSATVTFSAPLVGQVRVTKSASVDVSRPFSISSWQAPFGPAKSVVQVSARCTASVGLHVHRIRLVPPEGSERRVRPLFSCEEAQNIELHTEHSTSVAFVVDDAPSLPELWKAFVDYSFPVFEARGDSVVMVSTERSHSADVVVGVRPPRFALEVFHPAQAIICRTFPIRAVLRCLEPPSSSEPAADSEARLHIRAADPRFWAVQGFRTRSIALPTDTATAELSLKLVALQVGHVQLPSVVLTCGSPGSTESVISRTEHIFVLPEPQLCLSFQLCRREDEDEAEEEDEAKRSMQSDADADVVVCWIEDSTQRAMQSIQALLDRFKAGSGFRGSARHFKTLMAFNEWLALQPPGIERRLRVVTNRVRTDDGGENAASLVVLRLRQHPQFAGVPVIVFCGDIARAESLARLPNVTVTRDFRKVAEVCTAVSAPSSKRPLSASVASPGGFAAPPTYKPPRPPMAVAQ